MLPTVAIVGRPNVGKSTLFNRISGRQAALVNKRAGVTRDRHYGEVEWLGHAFCLIDTGGIVLADADNMSSAIREQAAHAIREARLILLVIDVRDNITALDQEIAALLRKSGKQVLLVANKAEAPEKIQDLTAFYALGFGEPLWISAEHGHGIGDLLDKVLTHLPPLPKHAATARGIQVAIVGRPNVGKSSLINCLLREDRLLVDSTPGTTRDAIDSAIQVNKKPYTLIDTAGMRKARRIEDHLEKASVAISLQRIQQCDVALLVLDATTKIGEQDIQVATYIERHGKACVFLINKWDAIEKDTNTYELLVQEIKTKIAFLAHAPILSLSALTGQRVSKIFPLIDQVYAESCKRIATAKLNDTMKDIARTTPPPLYKNKFLTFSFFLQSSIRPPTFLCFTNYPQGIPRAYQRYLENQIRAHFGFAGTPIRLYFRPKSS